MDEERVEEIVTKFLINTCRLRPQFSVPAVQAAATSVVISNMTYFNAAVSFIPLTTGSVAEFYIEPMLPLVSDIDVMYHRSDLLAIPQGQSPPTELPAEFHNYVHIAEIIDSHFPGYVYLQLRYLLTECNDDSTYNAVEYDRDMGHYLSNNPYADYVKFRGFDNVVHGPAVSGSLGGLQFAELFSYDSVPCVRCLSWPSQAIDWPTRRRNYGWPDSATVDLVVNNGCDVVLVAHRQCRQHGWMGKYQHRLSFSRAEIVLLNSWMSVQQIIYHMLRVFMKAERLTDSTDNSRTGKLSNYHIKSLLLWAFEEMPKNWWCNDLSLISICVELLHNLSVWLTEARCPHYFINKCNLVDNSFNLNMIVNRLVSISKSWLSSWFVNNYIRKCSQLCPRNIISWLFDDVSTIARLQNAVSEIVDWRMNSTFRDTWLAFRRTAADISILVSANLSHLLSSYTVTAWSLYRFRTELTKNSSSLSIYFLSMTLLHIACKISRDGFTKELMDFLVALVGYSILADSIPRSCGLLLSEVAKRMKIAANKPETSEQLIEIELIKAYLYRALRCTDSDWLAHVYLAVLQYTTGQYQTAIDHCTLVTRSQDHSPCNSHVVHGELLPKIDDDIDVVLGLAVFYQHVRTSAMNRQHTQHITVFTTEMFSDYLHMKCLSVINCQQLYDTAQSQSSTYQVQSCMKHISDMQQLYIADILLWKLVNGCSSVLQCLFKRQFHRCQFSSKCPTQLNTSRLVELLQQSAVEHLTTFRQLEARDFGSVVTIVTTDFEAVYAYKRGDYQRCLRLSTENVHTLLDADCTPDVPILPEIIQLLDDDIVSLTALTLIVNPECGNHIEESCISQLTLSLYLMTQCQLKLRHSVTSLAQTLNYIEVAVRKHAYNSTLNLLTLKLTAGLIRRYWNK